MRPKLVQMWSRRGIRLVVGIAAATTLVGGVFAAAAISNTDGIIRGCYDKHGNLRISSSGSCDKHETAIS